MNTPPPLRNLRFTVRYDGTAFHGWQTQPGYRTVQETFEAALQSVTQEPRLRANPSGRTDAGVHAVGQVVNVYSVTRHAGPVLVKAVNARLPEDVCVRSCDDAPQSFCANKDAVKKRYRYRLYDGRPQDPFSRRYAHHSRKRLDEAAMDAGAQLLVGRHDFRCFETNYPNRLTSVRTVYAATVVRTEPEFLHFDVEADGFLYNMVRAMAGTLLKVGRGEWPPEMVTAILAALDRRAAGPNAPPEGLCLMSVTYPSAPETTWPTP